MEFWLIVLASFAASLLTFFAGFGLGTIMLPVFAIFFPLELAIAATAIVHFANNIFKYALLRREIDWQVVLRFGLPAMCSALIGAYTLLMLAETAPIAGYRLFGREFSLLPIKVIVGALLFFFALIDVLPAFQRIHFQRNMLIPGGLISGFFGGLSGHQGALRSAFLMKAGLSKQSFIATGVAISCMIDVVRLTMYSSVFSKHIGILNWPVIGAAIAAAVAGAITGNKLLSKITLKSLQFTVFVLLCVVSALLIAGII